MVDLYSYDTATENECYEDLYTVIDKLNGMVEDDLQDDRELCILERLGQRLQYIAQRLKELKND